MNEKNVGIFIAYIVRSAVERGDFMKTLQEALKTGESIDTEFKSLKDKIAVTIWKENDI